MIETVVKRDGSKEPFCADKLNKWAEWAANVGADWSSIVLEAYRKCNNEVHTEDLHQAMIDACLERKDEEHFKMAGRLLVGKMYKDSVGSHDTIPNLKEHWEKMVELGYCEEVPYSDEEFQLFQDAIKHERDLELNYTEAKQILDKYAVKDRVKNKLYETPQFMYMRMAMGNMKNQPEDRRANDVIELYEMLSNKEINPPTPYYINLGTPKRAYASCCVYTTLDEAPSLAAGDHIAYMMTCASAGIGSHLKTRSKGDRVRGGTIKHMGKLPYYRMVQSAVSANLQNSRGGAATVHFNVLDPEIEDLLALRNPMTVVEKRIKDIDYSFGYNRFFAEKAANDEKWMLVSYSENPELYEAMYQHDNELFAELYNKHLNNKKVKKKFVKARDIVIRALTESVETRMYLHRTDIMNWHTPFKDKIYSSNLCQEIGLPTSGYKSVADLYKEDGEGEIGLCNLAAIVAGRVTKERYPKVAYYTLLMIDNVIELMDYPFPHLATTAKARRSVGVGITNLAHDMAKRGLKYSSKAGKNYMHRLAEMHSFYLHEASLKLAEEKGVCAWADRTKYPDGWLPIDTYEKSVDLIHSQKLLMDWEGLRARIVAMGGIRHSVLEAFMPNESSSQATGTTNSIYPVRNLVTKKVSGSNTNYFLAPELSSLADQYEIAFDIETRHLIDMYAIFQKFCGQAISADWYLKFDEENPNISADDLLTNFFYHTAMAVKTRYYVNSAGSVVKQTEVQDAGCAGGGCAL